jgi:hypothetical protein
VDRRRNFGPQRPRWNGPGVRRLLWTGAAAPSVQLSLRQARTPGFAPEDGGYARGFTAIGGIDLPSHIANGVNRGERAIPNFDEAAMSDRQRLSRFVFWLLTSTALSSLSLAQEPSGSAVQVTPDADATGITGARVLEAPGDIYQGDQITTDPSGQAQIQFVDDTRFVVGPNSRVTIDEFVFNPDRTAQSVVFNAAKGTFRFISGNSPSQAYTVHSPTMTVGVRGSAYNFAVLVGGRTLLQWLEDNGYACVVPESASAPDRTECRSLEPGDFVGASPDGGFDDFRPGEITHLVTQLFSGFNSQDFAPGFHAQLPPGSIGAPDTFKQEHNDSYP